MIEPISGPPYWAFYSDALSEFARLQVRKRVHLPRYDETCRGWLVEEVQTDGKDNNEQTTD